MRGGALVLDRPAERVGGGDGGPTLEAVISGAWEELAAPPHTAPCPVCDRPLSARFGAGPRPVAAVCDGCGSTLA